MNASLDILSCGVGRLENFYGKNAADLIAQADVLFGSRTLLDQIAYSGRKVVIGVNARQNAHEALALFRAGKRVVVLASGDALYHGFGGTLARLLEQEPARDPDPATIHYHPNVTAFQALFHRLGLPWDEARLFSAHEDNHFSLREVVEASLAVIYGGSRAPAHELARRILTLHPAAASRPAILAENLTSSEDHASSGERILRGTIAELADMPVGSTSILVLLPTSVSLPLALGLPEDVYERENNLITPSDVRAVVLSRLRLPASGVLWDIGAGSGSVGLEAAALRPGLQVVAVERHLDRIAMIERNRLRLGVGNHTTLHADALSLASLTESTPAEQHPQKPRLSRPDRVFVGGGGEALCTILDVCYAALQPGGILIASAVTLETMHRLYGWFPERRTDLSALDIAHEQPLAGRYHQLKPQNRITLFTFCKPCDVA